MAQHQFPDGTKYTTTNIFPPIPDRRFDWCAQLEDNEMMQGFGMTEQEAVGDLLRLMEERADWHRDQWDREPDHGQYGKTRRT